VGTYKKGATALSHTVKTVINNPEHQEQDPLAILDVAIWPTVGSVIELGEPNRDAKVLDVRLVVGPETSTIMVDVEEGQLGEFVPRP
jgi:hypothetical protein